MLALNGAARLARHLHKMLTHQTWQSEGVGVDTVNIVSTTIDNALESGTCHSGVSLDNDGVLLHIQANGGASAIVGQWLVNGTASDFFVQRTIISGTLQVDPGAGFLQLNVNRTYDSQRSTAGIKTTVIFLEVSSDISGVPIVATADFTLICEQGTR